jgi:four helix bundle protein
MQDYRKLWVWQKSHQLVLDVYADSAKYLRHRDAIPSNIAEGAGRGSDPDFRRLLCHSLGSTNELEYDFLLAKDLTFVPVPVYDQRVRQIAEVRRMLSSLVGQLS